MKRVWKDIWLAILLGAVLPGAMLGLAIPIPEGASIPVIEETQAETVYEETETSFKIRLLSSENGVSERELEEYLVGVVLAEMPANFEPEALKAQSVVARTYTIRACTAAGKHEDAGICTDPSCCQAYISVMDYLERGGTGESVEKVRSAVEATKGQVLCYGGDLIEATYFSCSGGITEDAVEVWGTDYPYLRSVVSPGEEIAAHFQDTVSFSFEDFQRLLGVALTGQPQEWFGTVTCTAGQGVATMGIGGTIYKGTELRSLLGLRSTNFEVEITEDSILIHTKGYGHRVGMSQYGAEAMAVNGADYEQILAHYYQGTLLANMDTIILANNP